MPALAPRIPSIYGVRSDSERFRRYAAELVSLQPDVIWTTSSVSLLPLKRATSTIPPALREMARVCVAKGRIVVVDAYASEDSYQAAEFNRVERLPDPSHVRSLSLLALLDLFARAGLPEPKVTLYNLQVEVRDLLARAFPNPGDEIEIVKTIRASAADGRLGIPVHLDGDNVHVTYRAAILTAQPSG